MEPEQPQSVDATTVFSLPGAQPARQPVDRPTGASARPAWVEEVRQSLMAPGTYLAYDDAGRRLLVPIAQELTRIGRSLSADVRFDDATVSRRHAVVATRDDGVHVLDDRSLNGIYVNGIRVDSCLLHDGDEIGVGRHSLWFLDAAPAGREARPAPQPAVVSD